MFPFLFPELKFCSNPPGREKAEAEALALKKPPPSKITKNGGNHHLLRWNPPPNLTSSTFSTLK